MVRSDIGCVMYYSDERYSKLAEVAYSTFNKFHKHEVQTWLITPEKMKDYQVSKLNGIPAGILKFSLAYEIALKKNLKKIIILGVDTITCSRLDEFLDDDKTDILCSLDYPYQLVTEYIISPDSETHINADVVCFNNLEALKKVIAASQKHKVYFEQGGLNEVFYMLNNIFTGKIVDYPYLMSDVVYNARSKGNTTAMPGAKPWDKYTNKFHVVDNRLFTGIHENNSFRDKQIKIFHYCDGLGTLRKDKFEETVNWWINIGFNKDTKDFFSNISEECRMFFNSRFVIE